MLEHKQRGPVIMMLNLCVIHIKKTIVINTHLQPIKHLNLYVYIIMLSLEVVLSSNHWIWINVMIDYAGSIEGCIQLCWMHYIKLEQVNFFHFHDSISIIQEETSWTTKSTSCICKLRGFILPSHKFFIGVIWTHNFSVIS